MQAMRSSETSGDFQQTTRRHTRIPDDSTLQADHLLDLFFDPED
jgi:hypothetical protein